MKKKILIKIFIVSLLFIGSVGICYSQLYNVNCKDNNDVSLIVNIKDNNRQYERSNLIPLVEAYYDTQRNEVECHLADIGTAHIYIVNIRGAVVDEKTVETDIPVYVTLTTTSCVGGFYIVIDSDYVYAEGYSSL